MKKLLRLWLYKRGQSFKYAFIGIAHFFVSQVNAKLHIIASLIAIASGIILNISNTSWCFVVLSIGFVISAEMFNTSIEIITDTILPHKNTTAAKIKDVAAGAVLVASVAALITGLLVFIPAIFNR